jgi:hypothetical protein
MELVALVLPLLVLKQDYRREEITPLDACQVTLMGIYLRYHLWKARKSGSFTKGFRKGI